jgi:hypothetical protein
MAKTIPLALDPSVGIEIDGALVARELGMPVARFQQLMDQGKVTVLCERGIGDDAGLYRASFYYHARRVRLVVDADGNPAAARIDGIAVERS